VTSPTTLETGSWTELQAAAYAIRHEVFVVEQGVPAELEIDDGDMTALHVLLRDSAGNAIATGRLLPDGHIGRVAVRAPWRRQGAGHQLMTALLDLARLHGHLQSRIHAQVSAQPFYEALGFAVDGEVFMEAGIPHVEMHKFL
jgi:predicted GNAT family N-acyltransferase